MSEISIDSASTVNRDQASLKTTQFPILTKQRSQYTLKLKKNAENRCEIANSAVEMP